MATFMRAAACHASPIFLSAKGTTEKAISLIYQAARNKANLVVFPETYIPAFPVWSAYRLPTESHDMFKAMVKESIYVDGEEMHAIRMAARKSKTLVSIGISEKVRYSTATLFNSNVIIGADGEIVIHHRKLMPTFYEKLTWSPGDGYGLRVAETPFGRMGNLICGENTNPLARYALMAQGEQLHISSWPPVWPTRAVTGQTNSTARNYDNVAANRTRAAAHCFEAKCFGILCSSYLDNNAIETVASGASNANFIKENLEASPRGATMFLDATGALLPGFIVDEKTGEHTEKEFLQNEEGILYADMDLDQGIEGKQYHDVVGGYQRLDVFEVKVDRTRREPATFTEKIVDQSTRKVSQDKLKDNEEVLKL